MTDRIKENEKIINYCCDVSFKIVERNFIFNATKETHKESPFKYYEMLLIGALSNMKERASKENKQIIKDHFTIKNRDENIFKNDLFLFF